MIRNAIRRTVDRVLGFDRAPSTEEAAQAGDSVGRVGPFPVFRITDSEGNPYLTRYYLLKRKRLKVYLHAIHKSDDDRALHDHPWRFVSVILKGQGYTEIQADGSRKRFYSLLDGFCVRMSQRISGPEPGPWLWINERLEPEAPHRLEVLSETEPTWTLVFVGRKRREWGFHVPAQDLIHVEEPSHPDGPSTTKSLVVPYDTPKSAYVDGAYWVDHKSFLDIKFGPNRWVKEPFYYDEEPSHAGT